jgi:uncharacterized protein YjdB
MRTIQDNPFTPGRSFFVGHLARQFGNLLMALTLLGGLAACSSSSDATVAPPVPVISVTGVVLDQSTLNLVASGSTATLTATVAPATATNKTVTWYTSNAAVATVANGVVTPVGAGTATIAVATVDGAKTANCVVTVSAAAIPVTGVTLDQATLALAPGGSAVTLTATVSPASATNKAVTWSSSNVAAATVANGVVTPVAVGTATVTVTTVDGAKTATCVVTVSAAVVPVTGVTLDQASLSFTVGGSTATLTATVAPASATNKSVTWSTSNAAAATVANGVVTPVAAGTATITVTTVDGAKTATCAVTVAATGPQLIAMGALDGATDLSGLTGTLEVPLPEAVLGGMGSGLAWAGGATFLAVPDLGPDSTASYINRFHTINMTLTPNSGAGLPFLLTPTLVDTKLLSTTDPLVYGTATTPALTDVLNLNATRGVKHFTGRGDGFGTGNSGNPLNARLDPEAIRVANDGQSIFISDEFGPYVYQFDRATGVRIRAFTLPSEYYVANQSADSNAEIANNTSGRVANKGMEGLAITPDGTTLVGFMQSALLQDGGNKASMNRIITIDIATGTTHQYAFNNLINGTAYNSSEIVALNNHEFLVDERDSAGLGSGSAAVIKRLYKVDLTGAFDITGLSGEANLQAHALAKTLFLDFRATMNAGGVADTDIPSKIEGVAFGPDLVVNGVTKHTLWIADDNNFDPTTQGPNRFYVFALGDGDLGGSTFVPQAVTPFNPTAVPVTGVALSPVTLSLTRAGSMGSLTPVLSPFNATNKAVTWTSSNPAVATVSGGLVTPLGAGATTITVSTADGSHTATCAVTVN